MREGGHDYGPLADFLQQVNLLRRFGAARDGRQGRRVRTLDLTNYDFTPISLRCHLKHFVEKGLTPI